MALQPGAAACNLFRRDKTRRLKFASVVRLTGLLPSESSNRLVPMQASLFYNLIWATHQGRTSTASSRRTWIEPAEEDIATALPPGQGSHAPPLVQYLFRRHEAFSARDEVDIRGFVGQCPLPDKADDVCAVVSQQVGYSARAYIVSCRIRSVRKGDAAVSSHQDGQAQIRQEPALCRLCAVKRGSNWIQADVKLGDEEDQQDDDGYVASPNTCVRS
jgi:hypothetical protein